MTETNVPALKSIVIGERSPHISPTCGIQFDVIRPESGDASGSANCCSLKLWHIRHIKLLSIRVLVTSNLDEPSEIARSDMAAIAEIDVCNDRMSWTGIGPKRMEPAQGANLTSRSGRVCLLYTSPSPRDRTRSRMPS